MENELDQIKLIKREWKKKKEEKEVKINLIHAK